MKLSILTDQISRDVDTACEQITSWGGREVELRAVGDGTIGSNLSSSFLDLLCATLEHWDVRVTGIAPQAFKIPVEAAAMRYHRRILLPASLHLAVLLKSPVVHIGAPVKPQGARGSMPDDALEVLAEAAELAGNLGLILGLENELGTWAETGSDLAAIVRVIGHHALQITWDPAVSLMAGEPPFPTGFGHVRSKIQSVRIKDIGRVGTGFDGVLPGDGVCAIPDIITSLAAAGFNGAATLDPQLTPRLEGARAAFESAQRYVQAAQRAARK